MVQISGELIGAKELEEALSQLPKATAKGVLRRSLIKAAAPTVALAEQIAPRGLTGNLQASITVGTKLKKSQQTGKFAAVEVFIGTTTPKGAHAHFLEFGTAKMAPRPFLRPAWDATKQAVLASIQVETWKALAKAARTLARKAERGTLSKSATRALIR